MIRFEYNLEDGYICLDLVTKRMILWFIIPFILCNHYISPGNGQGGSRTDNRMEYEAMAPDGDEYNGMANYFKVPRLFRGHIRRKHKNKTRRPSDDIHQNRVERRQSVTGRMYSNDPTVPRKIPKTKDKYINKDARITSDSMTDYIAVNGKKYFYNSCLCGVNVSDTKYFPPIPKKKDKSTSRFQRLINGGDAERNETSWTVLLKELNSGTGNICGGAIINRLYVLSANHCNTEHWMPCDDIGDKYKLKKCKYERGIPLDTTEMEYRKRTKKGYVYPSNILVVIGQPDVCPNLFNNHYHGSTTTRRVIKVIPHPSYNLVGGNRTTLRQHIYDFVLLKLNKYLTNEVRLHVPLCLPPRDFAKNLVKKRVRMSGYGYIENANDAMKENRARRTACKLQIGTGRVISPSQGSCKSISSYPDIQICAFHKKMDTCGGDSGGPLTIAYERDRSVLVGVVSYGPAECANGRHSGVYARVTSVLKWIVKHIQEGECHYVQTHIDEVVEKQRSKYLAQMRALESHFDKLAKNAKVEMTQGCECPNCHPDVPIADWRKKNCHKEDSDYMSNHFRRLLHKCAASTEQTYDPYLGY